MSNFVELAKMLKESDVDTETFIAVIKILTLMTDEKIDF